MTTAAVILIKWAFQAIRQRNLGLAFSGVVPGEVVQHGPYRHVRHPLYLAYSIFWTSCAVLSASVLVAIGAAAVIVTYVLAARSEEQDLLRSDLGPVYDAYRKRTGLILPRLLR
jgi:protein-S-isoprenylcysteine O-methyltransferase Ste14